MLVSYGCMFSEYMLFVSFLVTVRLVCLVFSVVLRDCFCCSEIILIFLSTDPY